MAVLVAGFGLLLGPGTAQENPVTAIDIALEPDVTEGFRRKLGVNLVTA